MVTCRCTVLNLMSGEVATSYLRTHLEHTRTDGMGRNVHTCAQTGTAWLEERELRGYGDDVVVLRRLLR